MEKPERKPSVVFCVVSLVFYGLVGVFLWRALRGLDVAKLLEQEIEHLWLGGFFLATLFHRLIHAYVFLVVLRRIGPVETAIPNFLNYYATCWMGRYVPGRVGMLTMRAVLAPRIGTGRQNAVVASALEMLMQLLMSCAVGVLGLLATDALNLLSADIRWLVLVAAAGLVLFLYPPVFNLLSGWAFRLVSKAPPAGLSRISGATLAIAAFVSIAVMACSGAYAFAALRVFSAQLGLSSFPFIWAAYSVAGVVGTLAIFAPSGLGVREVVQIPLLRVLASQEAVVACIVLQRIGEIGSDLLFWLLTRPLGRTEAES